MDTYDLDVVLAEELLVVVRNTLELCLVDAANDNRKCGLAAKQRRTHDSFLGRPRSNMDRCIQSRNLGEIWLESIKGLTD
jgi:hypothetical protein